MVRRFKWLPGVWCGMPRSQLWLGAGLMDCERDKSQADLRKHLVDFNESQRIEDASNEFSRPSRQVIICTLDTLAANNERDAHLSNTWRVLHSLRV